MVNELNLYSGFILERGRKRERKTERERERVREGTDTYLFK